MGRTGYLYWQMCVRVWFVLSFFENRFQFWTIIVSIFLHCDGGLNLKIKLAQSSGYFSKVQSVLYFCVCGTPCAAVLWQYIPNVEILCCILKPNAQCTGGWFIQASGCRFVVCVHIVTFCTMENYFPRKCFSICWAVAIILLCDRQSCLRAMGAAECLFINHHTFRSIFTQPLCLHCCIYMNKYSSCTKPPMRPRPNALHLSLRLCTQHRALCIILPLQLNKETLS